MGINGRIRQEGQIDMNDDERDEYREELCHDRREREGDGWRNPEEEEEEEEE